MIIFKEIIISNNILTNLIKIITIIMIIIIIII